MISKFILAVLKHIGDLHPFGNVTVAWSLDISAEGSWMDGDVSFTVHTEHGGLERLNEHTAHADLLKSVTEGHKFDAHVKGWIKIGAIKIDIDQDINNLGI